jgi:segregation and condensation protein B
MEPAQHDRRLTLRALTEALLFEADGPISASDLALLLTRGLGHPVSAKEAGDVVAALRSDLEARGSALGVFEWGGGVRLATRADLAPLIEAARAPEPRVRRLSPSLLETLAVVAYRQPASKPEVDFVRGVDSEYTLSRLVELGLLAPVGRGEGVGRPLLYGTTPAFLDTFGLGSIDDLPTLRELRQLLADPHFSEERARLLALAPSQPDPPADPDAAS